MHDHSMTTPLPPKRFVNAEPGLHFIQEDSGAAIGQAVATWLSRHD